MGILASVRPTVLFAALAIGGAGVVAASPARATVMVEIPLEELVRDADGIVLGRVERVGSRLELDEHGLTPATVTTIRVERWIKGGGEASIRLREWGGTAGGTTMRVPGSPEYVVGQRVVVFLESTGAEYRTLQMCQGQFIVPRSAPGVEPVVVRDRRAVGFARWSDRMEIEAGGIHEMSLAAFLAWLESAVAQAERVPGSTSDELGRGAR
jgi:hypothetical protein